MSIECYYCERDLRGPHDKDCPKRKIAELEADHKKNELMWWDEKGVLEDRIAELEANLKYYTDTYDKQKAANEKLLAENERLRDPDWKTYIEITERWLEKYPPDIFTGVSGDSGPLFVVAVRNAVAALREDEDE